MSQLKVPVAVRESSTAIVVDSCGPPMSQSKVPVAVRFHKLISSRRTTREEQVQPDGTNTTVSMDENLVFGIFCNMGTDASRN